MIRQILKGEQRELTISVAIDDLSDSKSIHCAALIDTGASASFIDPSYCDQLDLQPIGRRRFRPVGGAEMECTLVDCVVKVPSLREFVLPLITYDTGRPLVLGMDWLNQVDLKYVHHQLGRLLEIS